MKYKTALQGNMKWYVFAVFLLSFCFMFMRSAKTYAYTIEGHYDDKATIWIDKAEISDDDMNNLVSGNVKSTGLSKDQINAMLKEQVVGKYYDTNIYDRTYTYHKDSCDEGQNLTSYGNEDKQKSGDMFFPGNELRINTRTNTSGGECYYLFHGGPDQKTSVHIGDTNKSNIWFRRKDANNLVRVDGRGGDFSNKDSGNPNVYQSTKQEAGADGRCAGNGYPYIAIDDETKTNPIANGQYESCDNSPGVVGRDQGRLKFGVNIDNRGPGGSGGEVAGTIPATGGGDGGSAPPSCQTNNPLDLNWWICGFIQALDGITAKAGELINNLLTVNTEDFNNATTQGQQLYKVWSMFRAISSFALVAIMLVMVIGQALGGD